MARSLSYSDAVKLLGGDSKISAAIDNLLGGALFAATAVDLDLALTLFDAKAEFVRLNKELIGDLRDRFHGLGRFDRTQRLEAAHTVVVLTAFFEAVAEANLPVLELDRSEQVALAAEGENPGSNRLGTVANGLLHLDVPCIAAHRPHEKSIELLEDYYEGLSKSLAGLVTGLAIWDSLDETSRDRFKRILITGVPIRAIRRYDESLRRLAGEFPEVAFWVNLTEHQATRTELRTGLAELERAIAGISAGRRPDERRSGLTREYRAQLKKSVIPSGDVPDGLRIPSLEEAYIDHRFQVSELSPSARPDEEDWWEDERIRSDLCEYLAGHLASTDAVRRPLLLLGQPGSGKSVLTKILAARLPASDFLVVRVVLRKVPADTDVQTQIENAVRAATGEQLTWPDLARSADGALPVVLLDGFDELLQATGVSQSDYLEKLVRFQEREADQGRPVAVLVTSRTAVADRVRLPAEGIIAVRLEPFDGDQVGRWLKAWNDANADYFTAQSLRPLPVACALAHPELAEQPLLLMMLALYDADDNALQHEAGKLHKADLYKRLLTRFAEREVAKSQSSLDARRQHQAVERELLQLAVTAFAMFNRGRQWVTEEELNADLKALISDNRGSSGTYAPLTLAQTIVGRFFFVHQAQALRNQARLTTCEFLHATFGEYLIAWLVAEEVARLAADYARNAGRARQLVQDDGFLYALLSFMPLTIRRPILDFLESLWERIPDRAAAFELLLGYFQAALRKRDAGHYDRYAPLNLSAPARHAAYSANLVILLSMIEVSASGLFPDSPDPITDWRHLALLWRSQLSEEGFFSLTNSLELLFVWPIEGRRRKDVNILLVTPAHRRPLHIRLDPAWAYDAPSSPWQASNALTEMRLEATFTCSRPGSVLLHAVEGLDQRAERFTPLAGGCRPLSQLHLLTKLGRLATADDTYLPDLIACYEHCLVAAEAWRDFRLFEMVLRQLTFDARRMPQDWLAGVAARFGTMIREDAALIALARQSLGRVWPPRPPSAPAEQE